MKISNIILSIVLLVGCTVSHAAEMEQIKKAKSVFKTFKKDIKCVWEGNCSTKQEKRLLRQGFQLVFIVGVLGAVAFGGFKWWHRKHPDIQGDKPGVPVVVSGGKQETNGDEMPTVISVSEITAVKTVPENIDDVVGTLASLADTARMNVPKEPARTLLGGGMEASTLEESAVDEELLATMIEWAREQYGQINQARTNSGQQILEFLRSNASEEEFNEYNTALLQAKDAWKTAELGGSYGRHSVDALQHQLNAIEVLKKVYQSWQKELSKTAEKGRKGRVTGLFID